MNNRIIVSSNAITNQNESKGANITSNVTNERKMDSNQSAVDLGNFKVLYLVTQLVGITLIILMTSWIGIHLNGFGGTSNPSIEFNWHPFLMTIGMIFLYGNSILIYRGLRQTRKKKLKLIHATIHGIAFILIVIALITVFDSHNLAVPPIPNMYSLHSWLGLGAVILFAGQWVGGFVAFLLPGMKESLKATIMPFHVYFGLFGFVLAIASALMGLTEKAIFSMSKSYANLPNSGLILNVIGVLMAVFGGMVVYLASEPSYKRRPLPEDAMLLTNAPNE
ncbi:plasma membrane ascorbate-dependent reductase CYBRD1 isoform X2 [Condylostylus longicornis]|uniref:plasma membrane ascorbate-dependent reductase CYBRD1 isoform X2 n=1 Tax=Condylostylus longicornis TaxID=2530218 RepID=UPI00244D99DE|nr:plasma membrane ascorbate-dependent reductase CYBRD1 isoform X2 [Condylostylus longicornis]